MPFFDNEKKKQNRKEYEEIKNLLKQNPLQNYFVLRNRFTGQLINAINVEKKAEQQHPQNQIPFSFYMSIDVQLRKVLVKHIRKIFREKMPAKPKFYMLFVLRDLMELKDHPFVHQFEDKLSKTLLNLVNSSSSNNYEDCLKKYYKEDSAENRKFSSLFHQLLLECWKYWDLMYSDKRPNIKRCRKKIKYQLPTNDVLYFQHHSQQQQQGMLTQSEIQQQKRQKSQNIQKNSGHRERLLSTERCTIEQESSLQKSVKKFMQQNEVLISKDHVIKNLESCYQTRKFFVELMSQFKDSDEFPTDIVQEFQAQFQQFSDFFYTSENQVMKMPEFDQRFKQNYLQDKEINQTFLLLFQELKQGQISQGQFLQRIKQLEQSATTFTMKSFENSNNQKKRSPSFGTKDELEIVEERIKESRNGEFEQSEVQFTNSEFQTKSSQRKRSQRFGEDVQFEEQIQDNDFEMQKCNDFEKQIERQEKFKQFEKLNSMQTIEEDSREILESNFSKLTNSRQSNKQKNSPFAAAFDVNNNNPQQKVIKVYRNNSQVSFKKKKINDRRKSVQNTSNFDFDFQEQDTHKFQILRKKSQQKKQQDQLQNVFDDFNNSTQNNKRQSPPKHKKTNTDFEEVFDSKVFNKNINLSSTKFNNTEQKQIQKLDEEFNQDPFQDFEQKQNLSGSELSEDNTSQQQIKQTQEIKRVTMIQNSNNKRPSTSSQKIALDKQALDSCKFNAPQFGQEQIQQNQMPILSPRKSEYKNSLFKNTQNNPQSSQIIKVSKKNSMNLYQGAASQIQENFNIEENEQYQNLKIKNQYLQQQCDTLFEKVMQQQNIINKFNNKKSDQDEEEIVKQIQQQQMQRKLNFLEQENKSLKKEVELLYQEKNKIEIKKTNENKLLKELTKELEKFTDQLKLQLTQEKQKNKQMQKKMDLQEQLIHEFSEAQKENQTPFNNITITEQPDIEIQERRTRKYSSTSNINNEYIKNQSQQELIKDNKITYTFDQISEYPTKKQKSFSHNIDTQKASIHYNTNFQEQNTIIEKPVRNFDYSNKMKLEYFEKELNGTFIRACSVFEKSILFENEQIQILCNTNKMFNRTQKEIFLTLNYIPKQPNLKLTTHLVTFENIVLNPKLIVAENLINQIIQEFSYKSYTDYKLQQFPLIEVILDNGNTKIQHKIPLPFTINKFLLFQKIDEDKLNYNLEQMHEIYTEKVLLNDSVLENWMELTNIFENLYFIDNNKFFSFVNFGTNKKCIFEYQILNDKILILKCLALKEERMFHDYLNWFCWIFAENNFQLIQYLNGKLDHYYQINKRL